MKVRDLKPSPYNPRKITDKALAMLGKSMREFGDLSGIIYNRRTGRMIGGHQRIKHLEPDWEIQVKPYVDLTGTVAHGVIKTPFGDWAYRAVDWDEDKEAAANIAAPLSRQDYNWKHEPILYGWKEGAAHYFCRDFTQTTVIDDDVDPATMTKEALLDLVKKYREQETVIREDRPLASALHPTMKPIGLVARMIRNSTPPARDKVVPDTFSGSGTTIMAADQVMRTAYGMEIDPVFVDVIVQRWEAFTGLKAERAEGGC